MKRATKEKRGALRVMLTWGSVAGGVFVVVTAFGQTPDGQTPSRENPCNGLTGAAFGLCSTYCEAQDCDTHDRLSCAVLRRYFEKLTGNPVFPCDPRCGDGVVNPSTEQCDDGNNEFCDGCSGRCREEFCGDGVVCTERGEECEPGDFCDDEDQSPCRDDCTCRESCPCGTRCAIDEVTTGTCQDPDGDDACECVLDECPCNSPCQIDGLPGTCLRVTNFQPCVCVPTGFSCGNDVLEPGEECEPNAFPTNCPTGSSCRSDCRCSCVCDDPCQLTGEPDGICASTMPGQPCECIPHVTFCGNGIQDSGEECDPNAPAPNCPSGSFCRADCRCDCVCDVSCELPSGTVGICRDFDANGLCECDPVGCGNELVDPDEECDPPGSLCPNGLYCLTNCTCQQRDCPCGSSCPSAEGTIGICRDFDHNGICACIPDVPFCGNGILDEGEQCDPSAGAACPFGFPCRADCTCDCPCGSSCPIPGFLNGLCEDVDLDGDCECNCRCGQGCPMANGTTGICQRPSGATACQCLP